MLIASIVAVALSGALAADDGFKPIFDGKSLAGWDGNPDYWRVEDGCIVGQTTAEKPARGNTFIVWRNGEVDDFELVLEFRMAPGFANSGVQIRSFEVPNEKWVIGGYQADMDGDDGYTGALYGERYRGMLASRGQKMVMGADGKAKADGSVGDPGELRRSIKKNDWNEYRITAKGNAIRLAINGQPMSEFADEDKVARRAGVLALQLHAGPPMKVEFRNIRLKRLPLGDKKKVVLVAGPDSHGSGDHEHGAGMGLFARCLNESKLPILATVYKGGWPKDPTAFDNADALAVYSDGGGGHPIMAHLDEVDALAKKGVGMGMIHYAVEVPKGKPGDKFVEWTGGYFEVFWSVNPFWKADFKSLPEHPITRGVKPFAIDDEWYYHMRFPDDMKGVTAILQAVPPDETRNHGDDAHGGNRYVRERKGMSEVVMWAREREDGGRGFGFTGGHRHKNWGNDDFRKAVLNALAWIAKVDVPPDGVPSAVKPEELETKRK